MAPPLRWRLAMKRLLLPAFPALLASLAGSVACTGGPSSLGGDDARAAYTSCLEAEAAAVKAQAATSPAAAPQGPFRAELVTADASQVVQAYRDSALATMHATLETERAARIAAMRCEHLRPGDDQKSSDQGGFASAGAGAPPAPEADGASQVSGTNNQVAGVDEADFVKNDNKYIYVAKGSSFRVIEAWPADTAHELAALEVPGTAKKLFVTGDRALVYSSVTRPPAPSSGSSGDSFGDASKSGGAPMPSGGSGECTYGYDGCVPSDDGTATVISLFDLTNRAAPQLVRRVSTSSSLIAARRIGNAVHTVLAQNGPSIPWSASPTLGSNATEEEVNRAYAKLAAENEKTIAGTAIDDLLPTFRDETGRGAALTLFKSSMPDGGALTSVLSVDMGADPSLTVSSIIGRPGFVYASAGALYISVRHEQMQGWGWYEGRTENELSTLHKFAIGSTPLTTAYAGSGYVKGRVLNQLSMDEQDGKLRIATTTGILPDPAAHNTLSVLEDKGGHLEVVGQLDHIAETESIRSVRFDGDKGYVVTFKKTDPLFVFDLSVPTAPKMLGELKIPGFSTYMHMMDPTHLLTIGYDADDQGSFAYFTGVLLQIFDVTDPANPSLTHKEVIGTRGSSSEALTNHLAFTYFAPKNLLALPMTVCEPKDPNDPSIWNSEMTFSGLMVFDATVANGFTLKGQVAHPNTSTGNGYESAGCGNWWTNASSEVRRSIVMDDYVFSVSDRRIKVNRLDALSVDVKEISLN